LALELRLRGFVLLPGKDLMRRIRMKEGQNGCEIPCGKGARPFNFSVLCFDLYKNNFPPMNLCKCQLPTPKRRNTKCHTMKKLLHKTKETFQSTTYQLPNYPSSSSDQPPTPAPPTPLDILRYRSHHGANLGSIFVLEKWLFPSMFQLGEWGDSELGAVEAYL